jgi:2-oxoglutarate ferredoxin oxidoreductase subunit delta
VIEINQQYCKACGFCLRYCKHGVLAAGTTENTIGYTGVVIQDPSKCIGCGLCAAVCGEAAFTITR